MVDTTVILERPVRMAAFLARRQELLSNDAVTPERLGTGGRIERLTLFLAAVQGRVRQSPHATPAPKSLLDVVALDTMFASLRRPLERARSAGQFLNPWALAGLGRREVRNVAVLAGLWSPVMAGEAGRRFLAKFLGQLNGEAGDLPSTKDLARRYTIRTEHCVTGEIDTRMDLTIEGHDFLVIVEAKIDASLGELQLDNYDAALKRWQRARGKTRTALILLSNSLPPPGSRALAARWSDIAAAAHATLPPPKDRGATHHLINAFARHVARL